MEEQSRNLDCNQVPMGPFEMQALALDFYVGASSALEC
jgi:hypothetical protein